MSKRPPAATETSENTPKTGYDHVDTIGEYKITRSRVSGGLFLEWYDAASRQVRRVSLKTKKVSQAVEKVQAAIDKGATGDPRPFLKEEMLNTVDELLDWHRAHVEKLPSAATERIHIDILKEQFGPRRPTSLREEDFDRFRDLMKAKGRKITYTSRILTTLRSALRKGYQKDRLTKLIKVPEYATKRIKDKAPKKGPALNAREWAAIFDEINSPHLLFTSVLLINIGARITALLQCTTAQLDLPGNLIDLNVPEQEETTKRRPNQPITATLRPWLERLPPGHLVRWRGKPIEEIDTAFDAAVARAIEKEKLSKKANTYSARHTLGRLFRSKEIDTEEIGTWLANGEVPDSTTLIYAPWEPVYLINCRRAVEEFVREINRYTERWDLLRPYTVKPGWRKKS
jgi:hypothetical protein